MEKELLKTFSMRIAIPEDAVALKKASDAAFYNDFVFFGECPGYGQSLSHILQVIGEPNKHMYALLLGERIIGKLTLVIESDDTIYIGCLCIDPKFQGCGLGSMALAKLDELYPEVLHWYLITPVKREANLRFYTKNGFVNSGTSRDGSVDVAIFRKDKVV